LSSWVANPLWNGQEAPDFEKPAGKIADFETDPYAIGPFRSQFFLKSKSGKAKVC